MGKTKYFFNPNTLHFERFRVNLWSRLLRVIGLVSASLVLGGLFLFVTDRYIDSPNELRLKRENSNLEISLELMNKRIDQLNGVLANIQERDREIYRTIFEADPLPESISKAGIGGVEKYRTLEGFNNSAALIDVNQKLDQLAAKLYVQTKSFDDLTQLANKKTDMLASIPAIQPVSNKKLKGMVSGFGYRIHPIYKTTKMHEGCDFAAPYGSAIYATGNGVVNTAEVHGGYGLHVVVNHGYGYQTLYGHMSKIAVRPGQSVKRGQLLGYVGSTGTSTSPHLHYEVIKGGKKINPVNFFFNDLTAEEYDKIRQIAEQSNQSFD